MKSFVKYTAATILGIFLCSLIMGIISIATIAGMAASENMSKPITEESILQISLNGTIEERKEENPLTMFTGEEKASINLEETLAALEKAKTNDYIKGIYLKGGSLSANPAMLQELRNALIDFKKSGKFILAYGEVYSKGAYYLSSTADEVLLNPIGALDWSGMAAVHMFFKDALDKLGVKMQVFKVGTYKSAVEPYISTEMSPANREQVNSYLNNIWKNMVAEVATSRKLKAEDVNKLADSLTVLAMPEVSLKGGLVDKLCYADEAKKILKQKAGIDEDDEIRLVNVSAMAKSETLKEKISEEVAVYYAYGNIVQSAPKSLQQEAVISGEKMTNDLQKLRKDDDVKAVVIRVNSGGGSAFASEQIWREVKLLKEKKPVVISMGGMAASGGYYISCEGNLIYAEPTTLTGSIGIFGMIPDASNLLTDKLGLKFDAVKTNAMSDFGAAIPIGLPVRAFNETENQVMQKNINKGYELFTSRVAEGRNMKLEDVKKIAEGRVWTGEQAQQLGLVDKLGDLDEAIQAAADLAKIEKYSVGRYPAATPWFQNLIDKTEKDYINGQMKELLGTYYPLFGLLKQIEQQDYIQARMPYIIHLK